MLPGFGPSTCRALEVLRAGGDGPEARWATTVAVVSVENLGNEEPPYLRGLTPDPALAPTAREMLAVEARRQDLRNALITAEAVLAAATERRNVPGARAVAAECDVIRGALEKADVAVRDLWDAGVSAAR